MNKYFFIILKLLKFNFKDFFFLSFISVYSTLITTFTVVFILITFSVNNSFKEIIKTKIIKHDGFAQIHKNYFALNDYPASNNIDTTFNNLYKKSPYLSKEVVVRNKSMTDASYLKIVDFDLDIFNLSEVLVHGEINKQGLLIGSELFKKLNLKLNDDLNIIYEKDSIFNVLRFPVVGVFKTSILDFDKYNIYFDFSMYDDFFSDSKQSFILNFKDFENIGTNDLESDIYSNYYSYYFWYDKYESFLFWLNSYDAPINLLLFFIMLICFVNIASSFYIDCMYRIKDLYLFNVLGLTRNVICFALSLRYSIIVFLGSFLGFLIVHFFQFLQNKLQLIKIPEYVYYMKFLPLKLDLIHSLIFPVILVLFSFFINVSLFQLFIKKYIKVAK